MFLLNLYRKKREQKLYAKMGGVGKGVYVGFPNMISRPELLFMGDYARILPGSNLILNKGKFIIGKGTEIASNITVVTDNHTPTVGIPYYFTGHLHINDKSKDVIIEDDCWLGTNITLLPGAYIGRGAVVAACALVNKMIPPYAVVAGIPAKVIGCKFNLRQIVEHEKILYAPQNRLSEKYLQNLFETIYKDKKVLGTDSIPEDKITQYRQELESFGLSEQHFNW